MKKPKDAEIVAMRKLVKALAPLDGVSIGRVLTWAWDKYSAPIKRSPGASGERMR